MGSFLNVCIYRIPRKISIIFPPSHCPRCGKKILWYDNIPLLSYLLLKGKCRFCGKKISFRYFVVEFLTGVIFLFLYLKFGLSPSLLLYIIFSCALLLSAFIDWEHFLIPDIFTLPLIPFAFLICFIYPDFFQKDTRIDAFMFSLSGALLGFLSLLIIAFIGKIIFRKEAMGGGDLKLLAAIGSFLGVKGVLLIIFLSSFLGAVVGGLLILLKIKKKEDYIPYGPFLSLAAIMVIFWGDWLVEKIFLR